MLRFSLKEVIHVLNNVCFEEFSQNRELKFRGEKVQVLFLSNLYKSKGVLDVCDVAQKMMSYPNITFHIVGNTGDISVNQVKDYCQRLECDNVTVHGPLYGNDKLNILQNSDILFFPSYYKPEVFPLVLLEAMFFENFIVTNDNGAIKDIVEPSFSYISEEVSQEYYIEVLKILLDNRDMLERGKKSAKKAYLSRFLKDGFFREIDKILLS